MTIMTEICGIGYRGVVLDTEENVVHSTIQHATREAAYFAAKELRAALVAALRRDYVPSVD